MKYLTSFLWIGLLLAGCGSGETNAPVVPPSTSNDPSQAEFYQPETRLDYGDVEASVQFETTVSLTDLPGGSVVDELRTAEKRLTTLNVDINGPAPATLPVSIQIKTKVDFSDCPVVLRGKLQREIELGTRETIFEFSTLLQASTNRPNAAPEEGTYPTKFQADAFAGLSGIPDSMLLFVECEAILTALGTTPEVIDVATIQGDIDNSGSLLGNALRINYHPDYVPLPLSEVPIDPEVPTPAEPVEDMPQTSETSTDTEGAPAEASSTEAIVESGATETPAPAAEAPAADSEAPAAQ